jgi:hypothetical protein
MKKGRPQRRTRLPQEGTKKGNQRKYRHPNLQQCWDGEKKSLLSSKDNAASSGLLPKGGATQTALKTVITA